MTGKQTAQIRQISAVSRNKDPGTGKRRNLGTFKARLRRNTNTRFSFSKRRLGEAASLPFLFKFCRLD